MYQSIKLMVHLQLVPWIVGLSRSTPGWGGVPLSPF